MKTHNKQITLIDYLTKYLENIYDNELFIKKIDKNKLSVTNSIGEEKKLIIGIKVLKSYSLKELYEMQLNFFKNLRPFLSYELDKDETHIYPARETSSLIEEYNSLTNNNDDLSSLGEKGIYEDKQLSKIYDYVNKIINMSLGSDFVLDYFLPGQYKYVIHYYDRDYLVELSSEIF